MYMGSALTRWRIEWGYFCIWGFHFFFLSSFPFFFLGFRAHSYTFIRVFGGLFWIHLLHCFLLSCIIIHHSTISSTYLFVFRWVLTNELSRYDNWSLATLALEFFFSLSWTHWQVARRLLWGCTFLGLATWIEPGTFLFHSHIITYTHGFTGASIASMTDSHQTAHPCSYFTISVYRAASQLLDHHDFEWNESISVWYESISFSPENDESSAAPAGLW